MIIIGLLIGGIFGGMKLVDNANVQKTVQDLKSFDAAGLTFKDIYRALPGDMRNASTRLPNCNSTPCSNSGNGNRQIGIYDNNALTITDERFVFWQHLLAAGLITSIQPVDSLIPGEGQPEVPVGGAYRMWGYVNGTQWYQTITGKHTLWISERYSEAFGVAGTQNADSIPCNLGKQIDLKSDDGKPFSGRVVVYGSCTDGTTNIASNWNSSPTGSGAVFYTLAY